MLNKRILLVDDEPNVRSAIKMLLSVDEHVVTEAGNGKEALELLSTREFDIVITDLLMPLMRGDELAATLQGRSGAPPIIMITAYRDDLPKTPAGVRAVIGKPFEFQELRRAIADVLKENAPEGLRVA